jgi:hypothetical protein
MKFVQIAGWLLMIFVICNKLHAQVKSQTYENIVIMSDMSSRLKTRPEKDRVEIFRLVDYFRNDCVKPGKKIGDRSCISFSVFSAKTISVIDIDSIVNLEEKQCFVNSTRKYQNCGLDKKLEDFKKSVTLTYAKTRNLGLDLISLLIEKINNENLIKRDTTLGKGENARQIKYANHVYVFTDGYLEYGNKSQNAEFYFSTPQIDKIRKVCLSKGIDVATALNQNRNLGLPAYKNGNNKYIHLHVYETHERDKDLKLQTYKNRVGVRDNEILEAVWRKWAIESGFKSFEWKKY